eukprot:4114229-Prymnesium_polylepis.1
MRVVRGHAAECGGDYSSKYPALRLHAVRRLFPRSIIPLRLHAVRRLRPRRFTEEPRECRDC